MEKYIGIKIVEAEPLSREEFFHLGTSEGLLMPKTQGYRVVYEDVYVSWCPKEAFEKAYMDIGKTTIDFSEALFLIKQGKKITRKGWNGKGMFAVLQKGYPEGIPCNKQTADAWGLNEGDLFICRPYFQLKCADGTHAMWVPSGSDILAEDWCVVE